MLMTQQTWKKIENHYIEATGYMPESSDIHVAMAEFCKWIGISKLSTSLFGRTSMHTLLISQTEFVGATHPTIQYLRITPSFDEKKIEFRFLDTHLENRQWCRVEPANSTALINRLNGFLNQVGWI